MGASEHGIALGPAMSDRISARSQGAAQSRVAVGARDQGRTERTTESVTGAAHVQHLRGVNLRTGQLVTIPGRPRSAESHQQRGRHRLRVG